MLAFRSSLARQMGAIAVGGVGLVALRTQSDFWLGALATLVGFWAVAAAGEVIIPAGPGRRASRGAFLVVLGAGIAYGFGPWSDAAMRGARPRNPAFLPHYRRQITRPTAAVAGLADRLGLGGRATLYFVRWGSPDPPLILAEEPGGRGPGPGLAAGMPLAGPSTYLFSSLRVYFDACYLLGSLGLAASAGWAVAGLARPWRGDEPPP